MPDLLLWLYLTNAVLIINHEIDSAYWKEWEIFRLPGGITGFLLLHLPLVFIVLYGLVSIVRQSFAGFIFSLILCFGGIFAFVIHTYFLRKGREEFNKPISKLILVLTLLVSIAQLFVTLFLMNQLQRVFPPSNGQDPMEWIVYLCAAFFVGLCRRTI